MKDKWIFSEVSVLLQRQRRRCVEDFRAMGAKRFLRYQSKNIEETMMKAILKPEDYEQV